MQTLLKRFPPKLLGGLKTAFVLGVMAVCGTLLWQQIAAIPRDTLLATFHQIAPWQWGLACIATLCSFLAVGRYDALWHQRLGTGVSRHAAQSTGMAAIGIGQTIGASTVTGAFVRWHLLPKLGFQTTTKITIGVSLSFLVCWAVLGVGAGLWLGLLPVVPTLAGLAIIGLITSCLKPAMIARLRANLGDAAYMLRLTATDVGFAGIALWVLIPDPSLAMLIPVITAYTVALGAGLISNAPGGLGAFDLALLALLPLIPQADALAAILAFRAIYYLIPAILAATYLAYVYLRNPAIPALTDAPISDLCHQGAKLRQTSQSAWVIRKHLFGTVAIEPAGQAHDLTTWATKSIGFCALYKTDARTAQAARRLDWAVRRIADDAQITPQKWSIDGPQMRQLRRKLTHACKADVRITHDSGPLPVADMRKIADLWAAHHGGELGYSMGRYCPDYVAAQQVYLIWQAADLCGFITVQARRDTWAIDVIRHTPDMPSGAIHAAYVAIIAQAKATGVKALSLGAVPTAETYCPHQRRARMAKAGLVQFKQSFAPRWVPLYHAAPSKAQWFISGAHILWHIQRPVPRGFAKLWRHLKPFIIIPQIFHLNLADGRDIPAK